MSQDQLLTQSPYVSLPPITYKGQPVVTTEMLAQAYGCEASSIHTNFSRNRDRFVEGKHFYSLANGDLKAFRDCLTNRQAVVPARTRNLTLWLERGAARHAKMLNTDQAWDMFEVLEETFFQVVKLEPATPSRLSLASDPERKELTAMINLWVGVAPIHYAAARALVNAHFGVKKVDELTVGQVKAAIAWIQGKIDDLPAPEKKALPAPTPAPAHPDYQGLWRDTREVHTSICETATILIRTCEAMLRSCHQHLEHSKRLMELEHSSLR